MRLSAGLLVAGFVLTPLAARAQGPSAQPLLLRSIPTAATAPLPTMGGGMSDRSGGKSVYIAGVASALVPGAGQAYVGGGVFTYARGAAYLGLEIYSWMYRSQKNKDGDHQTEAFIQYSERTWDPIKYGTYINENFDNDGNRAIGANVVARYTEVAAQYAGTPPGKLPKAFWDQLAEVEKKAPGSHKVTNYGYANQQYFEMIGKYNQFAPGWDDYNESQEIASPSPHQLDYAAQRRYANDLYALGDHAIKGIFFNHVISAVDAMISARFTQTRVHLSASPTVMPDGHAGQSLHLQIGF